MYLKYAKVHKLNSIFYKRNNEVRLLRGKFHVRIPLLPLLTPPARLLSHAKSANRHTSKT